MPRLPRTPTDISRLADWLELRALTERDKNASLGDLDAALSSGSILEPRNPHQPYSYEAREELGLRVFSELEQRALAAGEGYPFHIDLPKVVSNGNWRTERRSYVYCLCLSYFGSDHKTPGIRKQRKQFEILSVDVAKEFVGGEAIRFGSPRDPNNLPKSFIKAVDQLCAKHLLEGDGFRPTSALSGKDQGLDLVAWRHANDRLPGKLVLFGNCASGWDWEKKLSELEPRYFCEDWMVEVPTSPIIKALFIPHRVDELRWKPYTRRAGIIFDRCRISSVLPVIPKADAYKDAIPWAASLMQGQFGI